MARSSQGATHAADPQPVLEGDGRNASGLPAVEARRYGRLAEEALAKAEVSLAQPQYIASVDREPNVQAFFLF